MSQLPRKPTVPIFAIALAGCASVAAPAAARAPAPEGASAPDREAQRTELYREAMKAAGAGLWREAKERLRAALAIRSSPKVLFSLAQTEEQLGQLAQAQADYARALEEAALEGKGDVVQAAELAQRALSARVPHVRAVLSGVEPGRAGGGASGASATLDDQPLILGAAAAVDPGEHRLVVSAPGMRRAIVSVKVSVGQQLDLPVSLEPDRPAQAFAPPPPPPPPGLARPDPAAGVEARPSPASPLRTVGLVTAGVGLLALGVGAAFGIESKWIHDEAEKACPGATCSAAGGASLWHDAVTFGDVSTVAFIVGGVGLVGGAVLWLAAPQSHNTGANNTGTNSARARVGFSLGSVELRGAW